jgi:hypothetical protein
MLLNASITTQVLSYKSYLFGSAKDWSAHSGGEVFEVYLFLERYLFLDPLSGIFSGCDPLSGIFSGCRNALRLKRLEDSPPPALLLAFIFPMLSTYSTETQA